MEAEDAPEDNQAVGQVGEAVEAEVVADAAPQDVGEEGIKGAEVYAADGGWQGAMEGEVEPEGEAKQGAADHFEEGLPLAQDKRPLPYHKHRIRWKGKHRQRMMRYP